MPAFHSAMSRKLIYCTWVAKHAGAPPNERRSDVSTHDNVPLIGLVCGLIFFPCQICGDYQCLVEQIPVSHCRTSKVWCTSLSVYVEHGSFNFWNTIFMKALIMSYVCILIWRTFLCNCYCLKENSLVPHPHLDSFLMIIFPWTATRLSILWIQCKRPILRLASTRISRVHLCGDMPLASMSCYIWSIEWAVTYWLILLLSARLTSWILSQVWKDWNRAVSSTVSTYSTDWS